MYRNETLFCRTKKGKYVKEYGYLLFVRNLSNKNRKKLLDTATRTGLYAAKATPRKIVHKTAEATAKLIGNKIDQNSRNIEETVIPSEKSEEKLNGSRQVL